jgi:integrase
MAIARHKRRAFGAVRKLPSGRYQASYIGPDKRRYTGPVTFTTVGSADAFLRRVSTDMERQVWQPPDAPKPDQPPTLAEYARTWLAERELATLTRQHYSQLLRDHLLPAFGGKQVTAITPAGVRAWHAGLDTGPTQRAHAYGLLSAVLATAVADELIQASPCRLRGASSAKRSREPKPATLAELETIVEHTPPRFRLMVALAAWCGLRFGELAALERADIDVSNGVLHVRRGVVRTRGVVETKTPKSAAGKRTVAIPPHLLPAVREHLAEHVPARRDALLFPARGGGHLAPSSSRRWWYPARSAAGRPDLRFHDLRHTGAVLAAATGATLAELMARLGHSTVGAAMRYQHAAANRDQVIAEALSKLAAGTVTPITDAKSAQRGG